MKILILLLVLIPMAAFAQDVAMPAAGLELGGGGESGTWLAVRVTAVTARHTRIDPAKRRAWGNTQSGVSKILVTVGLGIFDGLSGTMGKGKNGPAK